MGRPARAMIELVNEGRTPCNSVNQSLLLPLTRRSRQDIMNTRKLAVRLFSLFREPCIFRKRRQGAEFAGAPLSTCSSEPILCTLRCHPSKSKTSTRIALLRQSNGREAASSVADLASGQQAEVGQLSRIKCLLMA